MDGNTRDDEILPELRAGDNTDDSNDDIHIACKNGHLEVVKRLVEQDGVSLTAEVKIGRQPIHFA